MGTKCFGRQIGWGVSFLGGLLLGMAFCQEGICPRRIFDLCLIVRWLLFGGFICGGLTTGYLISV